MTQKNKIKYLFAARYPNTIRTHWEPLNEIFNINDYLSSLTLEKKKSLKDKFIYDLTFYEEVTSLTSDLFSIFILKNQVTHKYIDIFISNFILKKSHD